LKEKPHEHASIQPADGRHPPAFFSPAQDLPVFRRQRPAIDYKDVKLLSRFILNGARSCQAHHAVSAKKQRELARAIKRSRFLALLPYMVK